MKPARSPYVLAFLMAAAFGPAVIAAPQSFNTALPVAEGEFVFREQFILDQSGDDPSGARRERETWTFVSVLGYGVSADLAIFGVIPYTGRRLELDGSGGRRGRSADGLGDIRLFARYTAYKRDRPGQTLRIAPSPAWNYRQARTKRATVSVDCLPACNLDRDRGTRSPASC